MMGDPSEGLLLLLDQKEKGGAIKECTYIPAGKTLIHRKSKYINL